MGAMGMEKQEETRLDTVAEPQVEQENTTTDVDAEKPSRRKRNIIIASSVAVLVLAGAAGGYAYADMSVARGVRSAQAYAQTVDASLVEQLEEAQALADDTAPEQVADPTVLDALADAITSAGKQQGVTENNGNQYLLWTLLDAEKTADADTQSAQRALKTLTARMDAVAVSIDQKTHDTAKAALQTTLDSARKTLTDTDGKVADNKTRETLQTAIDTAQKTLDNKDAEAKDYNDQKAALDTAVKAVNDSKTAKEKADAEAAAAGAQTQTNTSGGSYSGGGYTGGGYTGGGSYSGGGYNNYYGSGSSSGGSTWTPTVGESVEGSGGQWFGGQSQDGVLGYDDFGAPITPFDPSNPNGWSGSTHVHG